MFVYVFNKKSTFVTVFHVYWRYPIQASAVVCSEEDLNSQD